MIHARDFEQIERFPYVLGRPFLTGVRNRKEALRASAIEDGGEFRRRIAELGGVQSDADNAIAMRQRELERLHRRVLALVAQKAHNERRRHAEVGLAPLQRRPNAVYDGIESQAAIE